MKMHITKLSMLTWCAAAILAVPALSRAQDAATAPAAAAPPAAVTAPPAEATPPAPATPPATAPTPPAKKHSTKPASLPFHGTLTAVDTNAMTLTVEKRTFNMTSATTITKDGEPAVLADGVVGEPVRGAYKKNADGKLDAVTIRFGGKAESKKKDTAPN